MNVAYGLHHKFEDFDTDNDHLISYVEINNILPWSEVTSVMKKWDFNKDNHLNFVEFQAYHNAAEISVHRCTVRKEFDPLTLNIEECSTLTSCYDKDNAKYDNNRCRANESCALLKTKKTGLLEGCIISTYCVDNPINRKKTLYNQPLTALSCKDGIKEPKETKEQRINS